VEEELFCIDRMRRTVSGPSQATVHLADKTPRDLYYECLDKGEAWQFPTPILIYKIDMQARYDAASATVLKYTLPTPISKKTSSPYSNSDENSDGSPPSLKRTDGTEMKIVVSCLDMYHTNVLMYRTMVLFARPTKARS
jgi:hypothetical protein